MIYVGVVTYNSVTDLPLCIAGLRAQTYPDVSVVVLDNASSDGSAAWIREYAPDVRLIVSEENVGYGRAHNQLIRTIELRSGDAYLALNPDAALEPFYIAALWGILAHCVSLGWATGKLLMETMDRTPAGLIYSAGHALMRSGFAFNIGYGLPDDARFSQSREVFGAPGAAVMYKAEMINSLSESGNFFDPDMFMYAEDTDVDWRARRQGWSCWYVPDAVAYHRGSTPNGLLKMEAIGNRYLSVLKNADILDLVAFNLPYMTLHCFGRLLVTPRLGVRLTWSLLSRAGSALRRRQRPKITRRAMKEWFRWSVQQPTTQHSGLSAFVPWNWPRTNLRNAGT